MSFGMKAYSKVLYSFLKVFLDSRMTGLASLRYHPSVKVAPLPLLNLLRKINTVLHGLLNQISSRAHSSVVQCHVEFQVS